MHIRMVVFSEETARDGIQSIVDYLTRNGEYRTDFYFVIAKGASAKEVLSVLSASGSISGIEMYEKLSSAVKPWDIHWGLKPYRCKRARFGRSKHRS